MHRPPLFPQPLLLLLLLHPCPPPQMDFLEHAAVTDVVVTSVVLEEVKARNASAYQRLRQLIAAEPKRFFVFANEHHR